jgi:hypothetical protein
MHALKPFSALVCANVILAVTMTFTMQTFPLPMWPMVIAWACFFHLGGGDRPPAALAAVLAHAVFGVFAGWLAALAILFNPTALPGTVWVPLVVGAAVGLMSLASGWPRLAVLPVCVYGFAANWAYLDVPGRFDATVLTTLRADNVIVALPLALLIGCLFGWANARLINQLSSPGARTRGAG